MLLVDIYSGLVFLLSLVMTILFYWHSNKITNKPSTSAYHANKDSDDYVSGKKYNEHINALDLDIRETAENISSFTSIWKGAFIIYLLTVSIILYTGYMKKAQVVERLNELETRVQVLEMER